MLTNLLLNIGLARGDGGNISVGTVLREVYQAGKLVTYAAHHSDTEQTVIAFVSIEGDYPAKINHLCVLWGQDCIAAYNPVTKAGELIGPKAAEWGEFNPEFFVLLDGSRLIAARTQVKA
jgi:hypothetical protein